MKILTDNDVGDVNPALIREKTVVILGYGNQGHAHALNLKDSGVGVIIALRDGSPRRDAAIAAGFDVLPLAEAAAQADVLMMTMPDEHQGAVYRDVLHENLKDGAALGFAHGLSIHFGLIEPRADLDVFMAAPKGPGHTLRALYDQGLGMPCLIGVAQDPSGTTRELALSYAAALGSGRAGIIESSFGEECETDLFSEQAILCGGMPALIKAGFETLVEAGYAPEVAYIECLHEVKQVADLLWQGGLAHMDEAISNTAEYGGYQAAERIVSPAVRDEMRAILADVQSGRFARDFRADVEAGSATLKACRAADAAHPIEDAGRTVRAMMPWLKE